MNLSYRRALSLFAAVAFASLAARADTFVYNATLSPTSPVEVTANQNATVSFAIPQDFGDLSSIASIQYEVFFTGDLLDPGETFMLCNNDGGVCYGKTNVTTDPMSSFSQYWNGDPRFFTNTGVPNGGVVSFQAEVFGTNASTNLSAMTLTIDGTAAPEPGSAFLLAFGIVIAGGLHPGVRRKLRLAFVKR